MSQSSPRPQQLIEQQREVIAEQDRLIELLKGVLAAADIDPPQAHEPWMKGLTPQECALMGALYRHYPNPIGKYDLLDMLPGQDHARDRQVQLVSLKVHHLRGKLGPEAIESVRGFGYRLGQAQHQTMRAGDLPARAPLKLAA